MENIDHSKTKAKSPQTNGICERFHRTILEEFYQVAFRKKLFGSLDELQADVDQWIEYYNAERTHGGKYCYGKTPLQTFQGAKQLADAKMIEKAYSGGSPPQLQARCTPSLNCQIKFWSRFGVELLVFAIVLDVINGGALPAWLFAASSIYVLFVARATRRGSPEKSRCCIRRCRTHSTSDQQRRPSYAANARNDRKSSRAGVRHYRRGIPVYRGNHSVHLCSSSLFLKSFCLTAQ